MMLIYVDRLGSYVERNPALQVWRLTSHRRFATSFPTRDAAEAAIRNVQLDCGESWHLSHADFTVRAV